MFFFFFRFRRILLVVIAANDLIHREFVTARGKTRQKTLPRCTLYFAKTWRGRRVKFVANHCAVWTASLSLASLHLPFFSPSCSYSLFASCGVMKETSTSPIRTQLARIIRDPSPPRRALLFLHPRAQSTWRAFTEFPCDDRNREFTKILNCVKKERIF